MQDVDGRFLEQHGMSQTRFYHIWEGMKARCDRPTCNGYEYYGGLGISYSKEWYSFQKFYDDMYDAYREGLTLDRLDSTQDYSATNCRWVSTAQQARNKSDNQKVTIEGLSLCLIDWKMYFGLTNSMVYKRNNRGEVGYHLIRPSRTPIEEGSDYGLKDKVIQLKLSLEN